MGLDQNDRVICKHLRMKMELLAEDMAGLNALTEADFNSFLAGHRDPFRLDMLAAEHDAATDTVIEAYIADVKKYSTSTDSLVEDFQPLE